MNKENIHAGHRERLTNTVYEGDFEALSIYQQVEYLLCYILPRGDVNPLAHRLVKHFGSFSAILDASVKDLCQVQGMAETSSKKLVNLLKIFDRYKVSKINTRYRIATGAQLQEVFEELLRLKDFEESIVIGLNHNWECVGVRCVAHGDESRVGIDPRKIYHFIDTFKPETIAIAHNHPGGRCSASFGDMETYDKLHAFVEGYNCKLHDSYIVGVDGIYSTKLKRIEYVYSDKHEKQSIKEIFGHS